MKKKYLKPLPLAKTPKTKIVFEPGDKVKLIRHDPFSRGQGMKIGKTYTIGFPTGSYYGAGWVRIVEQDNCCYYGTAFRLVKKAKTPNKKRRRNGLHDRHPNLGKTQVDLKGD